MAFLQLCRFFWLFYNFADSCCSGFGFSTTLQILAVHPIWLFYNFIDACCTRFGFSTTLHGFSTTLQILWLFYNFIDACCWLFYNFADSCCVPDLAFLQLYRCLLYRIWLFYDFTWLFYNFADSFGCSTILQILAVADLAFLHLCRFLLYTGFGFSTTS